MLLPRPGAAATIKASSGSQADVLAAVNAASDGDTVWLPPGKHTWSAGVSTSKTITIQGAGASSTVITAAATDVNIFSIHGAARITGIGFYFVGKKETPDVQVAGTGFRIDHCNFTHTVGGYGIIPQAGSFPSCSAGLIDNNEFVDARVYVSCSLSVSAQHAAMAAPTEFGTANAVYIEDNSFARNATGNLIDSNRGGKWVARFNTGQNTEFMAHGRGQGAIERGTRSWEIYNNSFHATGAVGGIVPVFLRSGEGLIFNNTTTGTWTWTDGLLLSSDRSLNAYGAPCNGSSPLDGNVPGQSGWLCRDQVGAGPDASTSTITGSYPNLVISWKPQVSSPVYLWGNTSAALAHLESKLHIKENRDFYDAYPNKTQTSPTSPFDGTISGTEPGVGHGTFANRPTQCTKGVAYWATDRGGNWNQSNSAPNDGCLYLCTATNVWTRFYTPFTYPHPLRGGTVGPAGDGGVGPAGDRKGVLDGGGKSIDAKPGGVDHGTTRDLARPQDAAIRSVDGRLNASGCSVAPMVEGGFCWAVALVALLLRRGSLARRRARRTAGSAGRERTHRRARVRGHVRCSSGLRRSAVQEGIR